MKILKQKLTPNISRRLPSRYLKGMLLTWRRFSSIWLVLCCWDVGNCWSAVETFGTALAALFCLIFSRIFRKELVQNELIVQYLYYSIKNNLKLNPRYLGGVTNKWIYSALQLYSTFRAFIWYLSNIKTTLAFHNTKLKISKNILSI